MVNFIGGLDFLVFLVVERMMCSGVFDIVANLQIKMKKQNYSAAFLWLEYMLLPLLRKNRMFDKRKTAALLSVFSFGHVLL